MNSISTGAYTNSASQPQSFKLDGSATRIIPSAEAAIDTAKPRNEEEAAYFGSMHERMEESLQRQKTFLSNNSSVEQQYDRWEKQMSEPVHAVIEKDGEVVGILSENGMSYGNVSSAILTEYSNNDDKRAALKELYGDDVTIHLYSDEDAPSWGEISEQRLGYELQFTPTDHSEINAFSKALEGMLTNYYERVELIKPAAGSIVDIAT